MSATDAIKKHEESIERCDAAIEDEKNKISKANQSIKRINDEKESIKKMIELYHQVDEVKQRIREQKPDERTYVAIEACQLGPRCHYLGTEEAIFTTVVIPSELGDLFKELYAKEKEYDSCNAPFARVLKDVIGEEFVKSCISHVGNKDGLSEYEQSNYLACREATPDEISYGGEAVFIDHQSTVCGIFGSKDNIWDLFPSYDTWLSSLDGRNIGDKLLEQAVAATQGRVTGAQLVETGTKLEQFIEKIKDWWRGNRGDRGE